MLSLLFTSIEYWPEGGEHDKDDDAEPSDQEGEERGSSHLVSFDKFVSNQILSSSVEGSSGNKFEVGDNISSMFCQYSEN